jgi:hypothetical protein
MSCYVSSIIFLTNLLAQECQKYQILKVQELAKHLILCRVVSGKLHSGVSVATALWYCGEVIQNILSGPHRYGQLYFIMYSVQDVWLT